MGTSGGGIGQREKTAAAKALGQDGARSDTRTAKHVSEAAAA